MADDGRRHVDQHLTVADRMATMGSLAAGVAHEINNPLTYVMTNLTELHQRVPEMVAGLQRLRQILCKPFSMEELSSALERAKALRPRAEPAAQGSAAAPGPGASSPPASDGGVSARAVNPVRSPPAGGVQAGASGVQGVRPAVKKMLEELRQGTLKLPVMDPRLASIQSTMERPDASIDDAVEVVGGDPVMAALVLRQANSSYYRLQSRVKNLREACVRLGSKKVFSIAIEVLYKQQFTVQREPHRTILSDMWRNMYISARCCGRLCGLLRRQDTEEMYLAALLHNAGEMLVVQLLAELGEAPSDEAEYLESVTTEVARIHQPMGAVLARSWGLPETVARLTAHHHEPRTTPEPAPQRVERNLVLAAWALAHEAGFSYLPGQAPDPREHLTALDLTEADVGDLLEEASTWLVE